MLLRDLAITLIVFGLLPSIITRPHIGVLTWAWLSYMNPHRLAWGFARTMPFAQVVAIVTLISFFISKEPKRIPLTGLTAVWFVFLVWMVVTTLFAIYPEEAQLQLLKVMKIQCITFLTIMAMASKERLNKMVWVIVLSIGFYGIKGGIFTLLRGGTNRVWGPPGGFIEENNALALALLMILPLMYYLFIQAEKIWVRIGILVAMVLCGFSVLGSFSRGAFIGGGCVALYFWIKSKNRTVIGLALILLIPLGLDFMPGDWHERMDSITNYKKDTSAMGRLNAWRYCINVASDRIVGAGFESWTDASFAYYAPMPEDVDPDIMAAYGGKAAHSIYFGILGDHGWIGLALFLVIALLAWRTGGRVIRLSRGHPKLHWLADLNRMIHVSMIAFSSGGAFLSLAYFDLYWNLIAIQLISMMLVQKHLDEIDAPLTRRQKVVGYGVVGRLNKGGNLNLR